MLVTTVSGFVPQFELNHVHILQEMGYEVHYASNFHHPHYGSDNRRLEGTGMICHQVDFERSPFRVIENGKAYRQLKAVLKENSFDFIHCHTPMGGVIGRLAAESCRRELPKKDKKDVECKRKFSKVFYTVHGFHFYRGAPWINWLLYYPMERWLAAYTDVLITINQEDYQRARTFRLRKRSGRRGKVEKINGVGIDPNSYQDPFESYFESVERSRKKREELGISPDACVFLSVGELTKRKNHQIILKALAPIKEECERQKVKYIICGEGAERKRLTKQIQHKKLTKIVSLLGYRTDIKELLMASDCFLFPSKQEGLPVALMEAKAAGLPCICSNIRGNRELAKTEELVKGNDSKAYQEKIKQILEQKIQKKKKGEQIEKAEWTDAKKYSKNRVIQQMRRIYAENLKEDKEKDDKEKEDKEKGDKR